MYHIDFIFYGYSSMSDPLFLIISLVQAHLPFTIKGKVVESGRLLSLGTKGAIPSGLMEAVSHSWQQKTVATNLMESQSLPSDCPVVLHWVFLEIACSKNSCSHAVIPSGQNQWSLRK